MADGTLQTAENFDPRMKTHDRGDQEAFRSTSGLKTMRSKAIISPYNWTWNPMSPQGAPSFSVIGATSLFSYSDLSVGILHTQRGHYAGDRATIFVPMLGASSIV
jgi:hypothetical protein